MVYIPLPSGICVWNKKHEDLPLGQLSNDVTSISQKSETKYHLKFNIAPEKLPSQ